MFINRRSVLSVIGAGAVTVAGCLGGDDTEANDDNTETSEDDTGGSDDNDGAGDDGGSDDETEVEPGSIADGFPACSAPDEDNLEEMFPTVEDFGDDVEPGPATTGDDPWQFRAQRYKSGDIEWSMAIIRGDSSFDELTQGLRLQIEQSVRDSTSIVAYISAEEYIIYSGGTDESDARDRLAAFPAVSESCANQAATITD